MAAFRAAYRSDTLGRRSRVTKGLAQHLQFFGTGALILAIGRSHKQLAVLGRVPMG